MTSFQFLSSQGLPEEAVSLLSYRSLLFYYIIYSLVLLAPFPASLRRIWKSLSIQSYGSRNWK